MAAVSTKSRAYFVPALGRMVFFLLTLAVAAGMFAPSHAAWAAFSLVQNVKQICSANPCSITVAATGSGHLLVVGINFAGSGDGISSVQGGGPWVHCSNCLQDAGQDVGIYGTDMAYNLSSTTGTTSITVTNKAVSGDWAIYFNEYSFTAASVVVDAGGSAFDTPASTSQLGVGLNLSGDNHVIVQIIGYGVSSPVSSISGPYVLLQSCCKEGEAHLLNTSDGSAPTWTIPSSKATVAGMAFKEVSGVSVASRSDTLSDPRISATSNHTIAFKTNTQITGSSTIALTYPGYFTVNSIDCGDVDAATSSQFNFNYPGCAATATAWGFSVTGSIVTLQAPTDSTSTVHVATGTQITIKIGSNATVGQQGGHWITNPSSAGIYTISVGGTFNGSGNMLVSINSGVSVQVSIPESLTFTVSSVAAVNCAADDGASVTAVGTSPTSVSLGTFPVNTFSIGCQDLVVSTNAGNGYSLTMQESSAMQTANGQFTIPDTTCDGGDCTVVTATTWVTPTKNGFGHTCFNQAGSDCNPTYGNGKKFKPVPNVPTGAVPGNISLTQKATVSSSGPTNAKSAVFASGTATGNAIIVFVYWYDNVAETATVSDSSSNAYIAVGNPTCKAAFECGQFFYAMNVKGGTNTTTVALTQNSNRLGLEIYEYSGLALTDMLDTSAGQAAPSSTNNATTPFITTMSPSELLMAGFADNSGGGTITAGSGWTMQQTDTNFYSGSEDRVVSTIGNYQGTATLPNTDNFWMGIIAAFRASGTPVAIMSNTGTVTNSTGRVKYRLSVGASQAAGTYKTQILYIINGTF